jgi:Zn-dependent M28 family amino/carboxypeptidase
VIELARLFRHAPAKRSVIFVTFSGEELGLLGSQYFVEHLPVPLDRVRAMLNFDMVGRMRDERMIVYGVETARELKDIVTRANAVAPLQLTAVGGWLWRFGPQLVLCEESAGPALLHERA